MISESSIESAFMVVLLYFGNRDAKIMTPGYRARVTSVHGTPRRIYNVN